MGYGIELLGPADLVTLQEGTPAPQGPIALIGAGTGLGQGFLIWQGDHYRVLPSEGGHGDFAPSGEVQAGLLRALGEQFGRVSWERLLSGPGIANIYEYLRASGAAPEQPAVRAELDTDDDGKVIVRHALDRNDGLSVRALELFWEILGAQAGNLALTVLATGGVYIAGGIAPRIVGRLDGELVSDGVPEQGAAVAAAGADSGARDHEPERGAARRGGGGGEDGMMSSRAHCHPERSEGSCQRVSGDERARSLATLGMTD